MAKPPAVAFEIRNIEGMRWKLINRGRSTVTGVCIDEPTSGFTKDLPKAAVLGRDESTDFIMYSAAESPLPTSLIVWCDQSSVEVYVDVPP